MSSAGDSTNQEFIKRLRVRKEGEESFNTMWSKLIGSKKMGSQRMGNEKIKKS